jgi:hypothetical protein
LAIGLYRVLTAEQGQSGLGLEAQQASVRGFVAERCRTVVPEHHEVLWLGTNLLVPRNPPQLRVGIW